ncbi:hypothetical protein Pelo_8886 [Pelomyxa schiedti]|nr:hypothetical protein Pelo_8886 [Pelomyxa schiedti]
MQQGLEWDVLEKSEFMLRGWLTKEGEIHRTWRKRWFCNSSRELFKLKYYSDSQCSERNLKGAIDLEKVVSWHAFPGKQPGDKMVTGIVFTTPSRVWRLVAEGATSSDYWIRGLRHLMDRMKRTSTSLGHQQTTTAQTSAPSPVDSSPKASPVVPEKRHRHRHHHHHHHTRKPKPTTTSSSNQEVGSSQAPAAKAHSSSHRASEKPHHDSGSSRKTRKVSRSRSTSTSSSSSRSRSKSKSKSRSRSRSRSPSGSKSRSTSPSAVMSPNPLFSPVETATPITVTTLTTILTPIPTALVSNPPISPTETSTPPTTSIFDTPVILTSATVECVPLFTAVPINEESTVGELVLPVTSHVPEVTPKAASPQLTTQAEPFATLTSAPVITPMPGVLTEVVLPDPAKTEDNHLEEPTDDAPKVFIESGDMPTNPITDSETSTQITTTSTSQVSTEPIPLQPTESTPVTTTQPAPTEPQITEPIINTEPTNTFITGNPQITIAAEPTDSTPKPTNTTECTISSLTDLLVQPETPNPLF